MGASSPCALCAFDALRIRDDVQSQRQFAEIKLRACVKIGEIRRDLEKAQGHRANDGTKSKEEILRDAGIAKRTAHNLGRHCVWFLGRIVSRDRSLAIAYLVRAAADKADKSRLAKGYFPALALAPTVRAVVEAQAQISDTQAKKL